MIAKIESRWEGHLGSINAVPHQTGLVESRDRPIHSAWYRDHPNVRELENQEIEKMLAIDVIKPAQTNWASQFVFMRRKDGTLRFCVDDQKLNAVTIQDAYPTSHMD